MRRIITVLACLFIQSQILFGVGFASPAESSPSVIDALRQGGYTLYVRHGEANVGTDEMPLHLTDCSAQRNLSDKGKRDAERYGEAIRKLNIPVQLPVQASPFCRTVQTAQIAFGEQNVTANNFWLKIYNLSSGMNSGDINDTLESFKGEVEQVPTQGKNRVIIAHAFPQGIGLGDIPYLGTVILKPLGNGEGYETIGRLTLEELMQLADIE